MDERDKKNQILIKTGLINLRGKSQVDFILDLINSSYKDGLNEGQKHWYLYRPSKIETQMLYDWINGGMKKEASIAFTAGPMRIIGQFCEMAKREGARDVFTDIDAVDTSECETCEEAWNMLITGIESSRKKHLKNSSSSETAQPSVVPIGGEN